MEISGASPDFNRTGERHENGFGNRRDVTTPRFDYDENAVIAGSVGVGGGGGVAGGGGGRFETSRPPRVAGQRFGGQPAVRNSRGVVDATDGPQEGAVLMVYGLNMEKMNADRLFNLLCLYGNVFKVF